MWIFEVEDTFMCLVSSLGIFNLLSSLLEEGPDPEALSLREGKFDLRERLDVKPLGGRLDGLGS